MNNIIDKAVWACLSYFNIFQHPLKKEEVLNFLNLKSTSQEVAQSLNSLVAEKQVFCYNDYYMLEDNINLVFNRLKYEKAADAKVADALKYGNLIRKFPFIKGVCVSGSLSKHIMKEDSDIDFFIISESNRIWISKMLLKIYKFLFLYNSRENFCINYFISEKNLYISEQNTYTSTELVSLIPLACENEYQQLMRINNWQKSFLPNFNHDSKRIYPCGAVNKSLSSKFIQQVFGGSFGNCVDNSIMKLNALRNRAKYPKLKLDKDFELMLRTTKDQIKVHNSNHQSVTMAKYQKQVNNL